MEISLTRGSYEAWLQDVFDDPVAPEGEREWYWKREIEASEPETLVAYVTKTCQEYTNALHAANRKRSARRSEPAMKCL